MNLKRWLLSLVLALVLSFVLSENAIAQTNRLQTQITTPATTSAGLKSLEGSWNLRLQQKRFEDDFNQKSTTEFRLQADLLYRPVQNIHFRLAPKFNYTTGFVQTQEVSKPSQSEWGVKEASINADPVSWMTVSAGALDQRVDHPWLLLYDQAFPAARLKMQTSEQEMFSGGLRLETAIPTSSSLSTQTKEFEKTPSFNSASLNLKLQKTVVEGQIRLGAYEFQNLPSSLATYSTYYGNTTTSTTGASDSQFDYEYKGTFASGSLTAHFGRSFRLVALGEWVQNSQAPSGLNQGSRSQVAAEMDIFRGYQLKPFYEFYRIEPDAAVGAYNADWLNTNRVGYQAGLEISYRKLLKLTFAGGERDVVYTTPFQQREKIWGLRLETFDVAI